VHREAHTIVFKLLVEYLVRLEHLRLFFALLDDRSLYSFSKLVERILILESGAEILINLLQHSGLLGSFSWISTAFGSLFLLLSQVNSRCLPFALLALLLTLAISIFSCHFFV